MGNKKNLSSRENCIKTVLAAVPVALYLAAALVFPAAGRMAHKIVIALLLAEAALSDIREKQFPLAVCFGILAANIIHSFLNYWDLPSWIAGAITSLILLVIYFGGRKMIGAGDVLLLGACVTSLPCGDILCFLFLSFFISSIYGAAFGILKKKMREMTVPFAPFVTSAFIITNFINYMS